MLHQVDAVTWDDTLVEYAQSYIDELEGTDSDACSGNLVHSGGSYGENLAWGTFSSAADAVTAWYDENVNYNYADPGPSTETYLHFTQLVWKSSTAMGCVVKSCDGGAIYVICEYDPAGNVYGTGDDEYTYFLENVFPASS